MRVCERVFIVGFGPGLVPKGVGAPPAMLRGRTSGFPKKTGWPALRRAGVGGYNLQSPRQWHTNHEQAVSVWCVVRICCCRPIPPACRCGGVRQPNFSREALPGVSST